MSDDSPDEAEAPSDAARLRARSPKWLGEFLTVASLAPVKDWALALFFGLIASVITYNALDGLPAFFWMLGPLAVFVGVTGVTLYFDSRHEVRESLKKRLAVAN